MFDFLILSLVSRVWLISLLLIAISGLVVIFYLINHQQETEIAFGQKEKPPSALSPVMVNVLVEKKLTAEGIAAFILDLCVRGYLIISCNGQGKFSLARRRSADHHLEEWEKDFLDRLLPEDAATTPTKGVLSRESQELWSKDVYQATRLIYRATTTSGFFKENPHLTRIRYKLFGLGYYFVGFAGLVVIAVAGYPSLLLLALALIVVDAFLILHFSSGQIFYSSKGLEARRDWLEFGNYLQASSTLPNSHKTLTTFEKFLPYAIALGLGTSFAEHFSNSKNTLLPDWYFSHQKPSDQELTKALLDFSETLGRELIILKGPQVS